MTKHLVTGGLILALAISLAFNAAFVVEESQERRVTRVDGADTQDTNEVTPRHYLFRAEQITYNGQVMDNLGFDHTAYTALYSTSQYLADDVGFYLATKLKMEQGMTRPLVYVDEDKNLWYVVYHSAAGLDTVLTLGRDEAGEMAELERAEKPGPEPVYQWLLKDKG